jgi:hypothetical protein
MDATIFVPKNMAISLEESNSDIKLVVKLSNITHEPFYSSWAMQKVK